MENTYRYDKRGNLTRIMENGRTIQQYVYGALNRLEMAVDQAGKAAKYQYNGLGHRVGRQEGNIPKEQLEHLDPRNRIKGECFLASNFPHFHRYDSLKSALYIHAVSKNINTFPKNQGRIRAAIAVEILDFTVMYR